jgi:RNA polymerase sigma-70 factor (ECF subfamily)
MPVDSWQIHLYPIPLCELATSVLMPEDSSAYNLEPGRGHAPESLRGAGRGGRTLGQEEPKERICNMALENATSPKLDFERLVEGIRSNDPGAVEHLYTCFQKGLRWYMFRRGLVDNDDSVQDVFLATVDAIQRGDLRDPNCLPGFVRGVARNLASVAIERIVEGRARNGTLLRHPVLNCDHLDYCPDRPFDDRCFNASPLPNAEQSPLKRERTQMMVQALTTLRPQAREILDRFYLQDQTEEQICVEMNLSEMQYRLLKSRAKTHLTTLVRRYAARANVAADFRQAQRRAAHG